MPKTGRKKGKGRKGKTEEEDIIRQQKVEEVKRRFDYLYEIYDPDDSGAIPEEHFGNFVRSLGLYPTNAKLKELSSICREEEGQAFFNAQKLETELIPLVIEAMLEPNSELAAPSEEMLLMALKSLDVEHKGHLTEGDFRTILSSNGEKLDPVELQPAV